MRLNFFKRREASPSGPPPMDMFVDAYGVVLEKFNQPVEDVAVLPVSKDLMKAALLAKYSCTSDSTSRATLLHAYTLLSTYQPLTDVEKEVVASYNLMMSRPPNAGDVSAERVVVASFMAVAPAYDKLRARVQAEYDELSEELRKAGLMSCQ